MKRIVVTGIGIVSCLGNNQEEVYQSLLNSKSGITFSEEYKEYNLRSNIHGKPNIKLEDNVDRKIIRFMGEGSAYNYIAMDEAIKDSGLEDKEISNISSGMIIYSQKVILTVGNDLIKLSPVDAFIVVISHSIVLFLFASQGISNFLHSINLPSIPLVPVSSSQAIVGAVIGIGLLKGGKEVKWDIASTVSYTHLTLPTKA